MALKVICLCAGVIEAYVSDEICRANERCDLAARRDGGTAVEYGRHNGSIQLGGLRQGVTVAGDLVMMERSIGVRTKFRG